MFFRAHKLKYTPIGSASQKLYSTNCPRRFIPLGIRIKKSGKFNTFVLTTRIF